MASRGWVVITIALAHEHGLKCVNLRGAGNLDRWSQLVRLAIHRDAVEQFIKERPDGPWWLSLTKNARHEYLYKPS